MGAQSPVRLWQYCTELRRHNTGRGYLDHGSTQAPAESGPSSTDLHPERTKMALLVMNEMWINASARPMKMTNLSERDSGSSQPDQASFSRMTVVRDSELRREQRRESFDLLDIVVCDKLLDQTVKREGTESLSTSSNGRSNTFNGKKTNRKDLN